MAAVSIVSWIVPKYVVALRTDATYARRRAEFEADLIVQHDYLEALRAKLIAECDLPWTDDVSAIAHYVDELEHRRADWDFICGPGIAANPREVTWYQAEAMEWAKNGRVTKPYPFKRVDPIDASTLSQSPAQ